MTCKRSTPLAALRLHSSTLKANFSAHKVDKTSDEVCRLAECR